MSESIKINWRAPLQAKGFLKIVEMVIALIALSLVAGFSVEPEAKCDHALNNFTIKYSTKYSFKRYTKMKTDDNGPLPSSEHGFDDAGISQGAQFFVAWGSLTLFYGVIAILVYMFITGIRQLEKIFDYLVWSDIVFHIVWAICWFIASVEWAVVYNRMRDDFDGLLRNNKAECEAQSGSFSRFEDTYVQAAIAVVFGFLCIFLWLVNIWWVFIDTSLYINWKANRMGTSAAANF